MLRVTLVLALVGSLYFGLRLLLLKEESDTLTPHHPPSYTVNLLRGNNVNSTETFVATFPYGGLSEFEPDANLSL